MSCKPHDWLELAKELSTHPTEIAKRSAVSRAYYAAHHAVLKTFPEIAGQPRNKNETSHAFVIRRVTAYAAEKTNVGREEAGKIAGRLDAARRERNTADYHVDAVFPPYAVSETLKKAIVILNLCDQIKRWQEQGPPSN
jgi:uncharacterized protein (UPF0332 family)